MNEELHVIKSIAGTAQQALSWGGGGAKLDGIVLGRNAWEFLFNFSKVTENAFITIKLLIFPTSSLVLLLGLKIHHH